MEKKHWTPNLSVDNIIIDSHHKQLIDLLNNLIDNCDAKTNSRILSETLYSLLKFAKKDFTEEEEYLSYTNQSNLENHREEHQKFLLKISMFCNDVLEYKENVTTELIEYLADWLNNYLKTYDLNYENNYCVNSMV